MSAVVRIPTRQWDKITRIAVKATIQAQTPVKQSAVVIKMIQAAMEDRGSAEIAGEIADEIKRQGRLQL